MRKDFLDLSQGPQSTHAEEQKNRSFPMGKFLDNAKRLGTLLVPLSGFPVVSGVSFFSMITAIVASSFRVGGELAGFLFAERKFGLDRWAVPAAAKESTGYYFS